jgi:hypothetical protein
VAIEHLLAADLTLGDSVFALFEERGCELDGGHEECATLADRFEVAVHLDRACAVAVAEHAPVHFSTEFAHLRAFIVAWELAGLVVEGFDFLCDGEVFVSNGLVRDAGVDHGHGERLVTEERGNGVETHSSVDGLACQGVPELVGGDVADAGLAAEAA